MSAARRGASALLFLTLTTAAILRFSALETIPLGLHGDEAVTGMDARRALRDGWLGPYLYPSALGQPTGPLYLTAALFALLPQNAAVLRASMAAFGVATVGFTYLAGRAMFSRAVGLAAAALLVALPWHLHLSRTAFMVNAWPCVEMAALWLLFRARRASATGGGSAARFALFGAVTGLGIYTYNAFPLSVPALATPFAYDLLRPRRLPRAAVARQAALAGLAALVVAWSMIDYARTHEEYFWHQEEVGVVHTAAWRDAAWAPRAGMLAARGAEWAGGVLLSGRPDDGDGLGERGYPLLDPLSVLLLFGGIALAVRRWRAPAAGTLLVALLALPWGALLTIEDGLYRRTFGLAPIVCLLAALPVARLWKKGWRLSFLLLSALLLVAASRNAYRYFIPLQDTEEMRYVFPYQVDAAARFIAGLPAGARVYWYSERWPAGYETRRWWAPEADVVERSPEFGAAPGADGAPSLALDGGAPAVVMLLGKYQALADGWQRAAPHGEWHEARRDDEILFRAYVLPTPSAHPLPQGEGQG